jgi:hypothetical protein
MIAASGIPPECVVTLSIFPILVIPERRLFTHLLKIFGDHPKRRNQHRLIATVRAIESISPKDAELFPHRDVPCPFSDAASLDIRYRLDTGFPSFKPLWFFREALDRFNRVFRSAFLERAAQEAVFIFEVLWRNVHQAGQYARR